MSESEHRAVPDPEVHDLDDPEETDFEEAAGPALLARMGAEAAGTFVLVFMGVGAALFSGVLNWGIVAVAFGFALGVMIAALIFGGVSGAHLNPAVTFGLWIAGRLPGRDVVPYMIAQVIGAAAAGGLFTVLVSSNELYAQLGTTREFIGTASNGFDDHSPTGFGILAAAIIEIVIAALLVGVVLSVTSVTRKAGAAAAPFAIGLTVGFLVMVAVPFTNGALNPARATGTALWSDPWALQQLWLFWAAPLLGAAIAGVLFRALGPREDLLSYVRVETVEVISG
ncbi:aquaporin [Demequina sp. NBRC 110052]|uniref:aquaporin n=1 Tax=Demequina sp. NBRC 110052 TaxID=1570341 RepID=UPI0013563C4D|nr:aquaporin [Demequina sp. NBRC 110052]